MFVGGNNLNKCPCVESSHINHRSPYMLREESVTNTETSNLFGHVFKVPMLITDFPNTKSVINMETSNF